MRAIALTVILGLLSFLGTASAGTLFSLREDGVLRSYDPSTGELRATVTVALPGKVIRQAFGLAVDPRNGDVLALANFVDDCGAEPTRTRFLPYYGCYDQKSQAECETAFEPGPHPASLPTSCAWHDVLGCRACTEHEYGCVNTCLPPPPCEGTTRTAFAGTEADACSRHDGDAAGCAGAYHVGVAGPAACYYADGLCRGCDPVAEAAGACARECAPAITCPVEGRMVFAGARPLGCMVFNDAEACGKAYDSWDGGSQCVYDHSGGYCSTGATCRPPACPADPSRTLVFAYCHSFGADRTTCESTLAVEDDGDAFRGCYFDETAQACASCDGLEVAERKCIEPCDPPVCREQPGRTLAGLDEQDCRAFDGDAAACGNAFVQGRCGPAACRFEPVSGECRACEAGDPGGCANACGEFDMQRGGMLVRVDPTSGAATAVRDVPGTWFNDLAIDAAGTPYIVGGPGGGCFEDSFLHDLAPGRIRPASVFDVSRGNGLAFDAARGLNRLLQGPHRLARFDMTTGEHTTRPVTLAVPVPGFTYVPACQAFIAAARSGTLARLEPDGSAHPVGFALVDGKQPFTNEGPGEIVGIAATPDAACPPETVVRPLIPIAHERLAGRRLVLRDRPGRPEKRRMIVVARDEGITLGRGPGSPDDPRTARATLSVRAIAPGGFDATYPLDPGAQPLGEWKPLVRRGQVRGYRWSGPPPVTSAIVKAGRGLRIAGRGAHLQHTLEAGPQAVAVELMLGERPYCLEFGGSVRERALRRFEATDAPVPASCRAAAIAP